MTIRNLCGAMGLVLVAAVPAAAQGNNDAAYCQALIAKYQQYLAGYGSSRHGDIDLNANARIAIDRCNAGDLSGIPVLEQQLRNARIDLPKHG
jgi:hypothetical protein